MLGKLLLFPFVLIKRVLDLVRWLLRNTIVRFFGVFLGAAIGFLLGKHYINKSQGSGE